MTDHQNGVWDESRSSVTKSLLEFTVCCSSMAYIIVIIVADVNKINLPTWFENFDIPTISLFFIAFILLYRSEEKYDKGW